MSKRNVPITLLTDFYKVFHLSCYNPKVEQIVSYFTPRKSRIEGVNYAVAFGIQYAIKKYFIGAFSEFFNRSWGEIQSEYKHYIGTQFDEQIAENELKALLNLHCLGYLPIQVRALPEGTRVPIGCPMVEFRSTDPLMFWLPEYLETIFSCSLWLMSTDATIADHNRLEVINLWYDKTVDDDVSRHSAGGNFSMRGMPGEEAAFMADAAHLLSFSSSATVGTGYWIEPYYHVYDLRNFSRGTPSTEHSVMESYGQEHEFDAYKRILTEVRPNGVLSMVSDTWDLWKVLTDYLPKLKDIIMQRNGRLLIRPDSGKPVDIVCGCDLPYVNIEDNNFTAFFENLAKGDYTRTENSVHYKVQTAAEIVEATVTFYEVEPGHLSDDVEAVKVSRRKKTVEERGVVEILWDLFGGTVNSKGYKVLDPHIGVIYGDAITYQSGTQMLMRLAMKGFAANNVVLGFGSFTYQYVTRDSLGFALKATHAVIDGKETFLFKDPVTDKGNHSAGKKSQKGMCIVTRNADGNLQYTDHHTMAESDAESNLLQTIFKDGELLVDEEFATIRSRLHPDF